MAFKDVIGQEKAINIIRRTLARDRVPSAYLFAGESGIGKKLTAINLAKAINCLKDTEHIDACDVCLSCRKIDAATHPDFLVITPEKGEIRVGEIRAVGEALSFRPYEGKRKVVIINDSDTMNQSAANAFLKTLEEPPDESLLILITAHPDRLPETIRSRCSRINFLPLSADSCKKVIRAILSENNRGPEIADRMLSTIVSLSMGRPGLAISSDILKDRERFIVLLRNMLSGVNEAWADREEMEQWFDMVFILMRDMVLTKIIESNGEGNPMSKEHSYNTSALFNADIMDFISEINKTKDIMSIIKIYDKLKLLKGLLYFNLNKAITWNYTASIIKTVMGNT